MKRIPVMNRHDFFALLPALEARFGNLLLLRDKAGTPPFPGLQEGFLSSIIQFQPLARLSLLDDRGRQITLEPTAAVFDPVSARRVFENGGLRLSQELVVSGDEASLEVRLERTASAGPRRELTLRLTGACLFSPQGVPYHWTEESLVETTPTGPASFTGTWRHGGVTFRLSASRPFATLDLRALADSQVLRTHYFTSFNLKKRYTYWVEEPPVAPDGRGAAAVIARNTAWEATFRPGALEEPWELVIGFSLHGGGCPDRGDGFPAETDTRRHEELRAREVADWDSFLAGIPEFHAGDRELERMYYTSWYVLRSNRVRFADRRFPYPFTSVNKLHYYNQFFWDSAYQAIAWLWYNDPAPAQDELRNFVVNQWRNGMIPYELFLFPVNGREWMDGDAATAGMTQPPVIGIALPEIYRKFGDPGFLEFFYDALLRYEEWLVLYRDLGKRGLSCTMNIWETGWDNSPRLDGSARNRVLDPAIESADFNACIQCLRRAILETARILDRPAPGRIAERLARTTAAMNRLMYDPEDGFYYDLVAGTAERIPVKTAAGLIPLVADIPGRQRRRRIVREYIASADQFMSGCPVPSVSRSEKSYNPVDYWRGANWPQITWTVVYALAESEPEVAAEVLRRFLETTRRNSTCYEYYDAESGQGVGMPFQGWGALYTDMVLRFVAGIVPAERGLRFRPLAAVAGDFSVSGVKLKDLELAVSRSGPVWTFEFVPYGRFTLEEPHPFRAAPSRDGDFLEVELDPGARPGVARAAAETGATIVFTYTRARRPSQSSRK